MSQLSLPLSPALRNELPQSPTYDASVQNTKAGNQCATYLTYIIGGTAFVALTVISCLFLAAVVTGAIVATGATGGALLPLAITAVVITGTPVAILITVLFLGCCVQCCK